MSFVLKNNLWSYLRNTYFILPPTSTITTKLASTIATQTPKPFTLSEDTLKDVQHHAKAADKWWEVNGVCSGLHSFNEIRVPFIRDGMVVPGCVYAQQQLAKKRILDVGCGGGILTEQLAKLGATVTGIDLGQKLIDVARKHMQQHSPELAPRLNYETVPIELHAEDNEEKYDAVVLSEIIEHIDDKMAFLHACVKALKPGGSIFVTTLNKTPQAWVVAILFWEHMFHVVPQGTHQWNKFVSPQEVKRMLGRLDCYTVRLEGNSYNFLSNHWRHIRSTSVLYSLHAIKTT